jgi:Cu(I)/Ag(I) efflux system membrane fusion protein
VTRPAIFLALIVTLGGAGVWVGWQMPTATATSAAAEPMRTPLYYQDLDGKPLYAAEPKKAEDGGDYMPVFEDKAASGVAIPPAPSAKPPGESRRIRYYRNPMGLPDTSPAPKKDSMGMEYIPVYADEGAQGDAPGTVRITPGRIQTLGVRTEPVELSPTLASAVRATGNLQFDERHLAAVTTKTAGWLERLDVAATGDPVTRGQAMAEIYSPDLVASEQEYLVAAKMGRAMGHGDPGALAAGAVQRLRALDVPEDEIARLRRTGVAIRRISIRAPEDGIVIDKPAQQGMRVEPGQLLYKIASLSPLWLIVEVQEQDIGAIKPGERARADFVSYPGRTFEGTVDFIYPSLTPETRTGRVRIVMPNADLALRASMYASVQIDVPAGGEPMPTVPESAVLDTGPKQVVLVDRGEGRFEPRAVKLGAHGSDRVQVLEGVKVGERVVVGANFLIDAESNLRAALQSFSTGNDTETGKLQPGAAR